RFPLYLDLPLALDFGAPGGRALPLSKPPGDVVLRSFLSWVGKNLRRRSEFNEPAEIQEGGEIRATSGLLHVVRDDEDGVVGGQLVDQFFNFCGRDRIEG